MTLVAPHETTSRQLAGAWPWLTGGGTATGPYLGDSMLDGSAWCYSPRSAYQAGDVSGPNVAIAGMVGRAKSSIVKVLTAYTVGLFGGSAVILDVKGEYAGLAALLGYAPVRLRPNGGTRLNLLDGPAESLPQVLAGIGRSTLGHPLNPVELAALPAALSTAGRSAGADTLHLGHVADALLWPEQDQAEALGYQGPRALAELRDATRPLALAVRHLVTTALPGVVDGPTSPSLLAGRLLVLDISGVGDDAAVRVMLAAAMRWGAATGAAGGLLIADECWRVLSDPGCSEAAQAAWKLARARGVAGVLVLHRLSDLDAVGPAGSRERAIAHGLVADSETKVLFAQEPGEAAALAAVAGLTDREVELVGRLPRGAALWRAGRRPPTPVRHRVPSMLLDVVDTDASMR